MKRIIEIKVGQVWSSLADGAADQYIRVDAIEGSHVQGIGLTTKKKYAIRKDRLKPGSKRYYLAMDNDVVQEVNRLLESSKEKLPGQEQQATATTETEQKPETKLEPVQEPTPEPKSKAKKAKSAKPETPPTA